MPQTNTMFSRRMPSVGQELADGVEDDVVAAAGAPAHLLVAGEVLGLLRLGRWWAPRRRPPIVGSRRSSCSTRVSCAPPCTPSISVRPGARSCSSSALNARPATFVYLCTSTRYLPRSSSASWPRFISGDEHLVVAPQHLAEVGRERVEVAQVGVGDLDALAPRTRRHASPIGPYVRAPAEHQQLGVAGRVVDLEVGHRDAVDLRLAQPHHQVVVLGLVGDVAASRRPSPGRRCGARARGCRARRTGGPASRGRAAYGQNALAVGRVRTGGERRIERRQVGRRPGSATARSRWRSRRRTAASPACGR